MAPFLQNQDVVPCRVGSVPSIEEIMDAAIDTALGGVETAQIGIVTAFDAQHHTVHVQPVTMREYEKEDGQIAKVKQPVIPNVPIWYFGATDSRVTFPVVKGSTVLLVHLSHAKATWQYSKGNTPVDPGDTRRHTLTDCVAIPGGLTSVIASKNYATGSSRVDANAVIVHTPGKIYLGGGLSTEPVLKATSFLAALDTLIQAIATAVGGINTLGAGTAAGAAITTAFTTFSAGVLRDLYKSEVTETE